MLQNPKPDERQDDKWKILHDETLFCALSYLKILCKIISSYVNQVCMKHKWVLCLDVGLKISHNVRAKFQNVKNPKYWNISGPNISDKSYSTCHKTFCMMHIDVLSSVLQLGDF